VLIKIGVGNANLKNNSATSVSLWLKKGVEARHQKNSLRSLRLCGAKKSGRETGNARKVGDIDM